MSKWNIYHKGGSVLTDANGEQVTVHGLDYSDSWMGECFVTISFKNNAPINFQIGDYLEYRGERFELNYDPGKEKQARKDSYGEAFVYDSVKFNALQDELTRAEFLDVVLSDNELHYTALPKFNFYVETLDDLLDRLQANLNEQIGTGMWKIFSRNKERSEQRGCTEDEWNEAYGEGTSDITIDTKSITIDAKTCWEALALVNSEWDVNFIVRGRNVYVGAAGVPTANIFKYGLGEGLYQVNQNADSDQSIITRLRAYGSEKNLPSHYYADLGIKYKCNVTKVIGATSYVELLLDLDYLDTYFKESRTYVNNGKTETYGWVLRVTFDYKTIITGYVISDSSTKKCRFYSELKNAQEDNGDESSQANLEAFIAQVNAGNTLLYISSGVNKDTIPYANKEYADNLPNNMAINRLMLPGFPHLSLKEYYDSLSDADKAYVNPNGKAYKFSTDKYRPYIDSPNIDEIGLRSGSQFFDTDDKTNGVIDIYPTLEEMEINGVRVDAINEGVAPDDDGRFEDGQTVANVDIYLNPLIDFDITGLKDEDFSISMKDGMCGGRAFSVAATNKVDGRWRLTIERVKDDALELYFPYKDYPIKAGDHFVLTGIDLPDSYVNAASLKLLKYALALLDKNDYTRYVYQPKVDEIFMARQHDKALADKTNAIKSLHDTLKAGDIMLFEDEDLGIDAQISIDQLSIKEEDGKIPTYEVTLREDKEVGTIQKIKQQISSLESGNGGSGSGSGGATAAQVKNIVSAEGSKYFLSKLSDDTANGLITFVKGLVSNVSASLLGGATFGNNGYQIDSLGNAVLESLRSLDYANASEQGFSIEREGSGRYHEFITNLTVWGKAVFHELEIRKLSYAGGNIYLSGAGSKLVKVVPVSWDETSATWAATTPIKCEGWKCYLLADDGTTATMNWWQEGDQVRCQTVGEITSAGTYQDVSNKAYWRTIPENGVSTANEKIYADDGVTELYDGQGFAWIVIGKHSELLDGYTEDTAPTETKDEPSAGDTIVLDGNRHRGSDGTYDKEDRQNVILMETTGDDAPRIAGYYKITEYKHTYTDKDGTEKPLYVFLLSSKEGVKINSSRFEWIGTDGSSINMPNYRGDWAEGTSYYKNDQVSHNNAVWICIANSGVAVTDEPSSASANWKMVIEGGKGDTPTISGTEVKYGISSSPSNEPSEWQDTPIDTSSKENQGKFLWVKTIIKWTIGTETKTTESKAVSYIGKDGDNGTSVSIKGSLTDKSQLPTSGNENGDGYLIDGYLWIYTATTTEDDTHHNGFKNVGKIRGEDGISATQYYYHVAWMNTSDNSDGSFTTSNPNGAAYAYIGTLVDTTEADSQDYSLYSWVYVKGDQGEDGKDGEDGKNSVRLDLSNENSSVTCDKDGNVVGTVQLTKARLYDGANVVSTSSVAFSISSYSGFSSIPTITQYGQVQNLTLNGGTDTTTAQLTVMAVYNSQNYYATYTITKVLAGSDGIPATSYWLTPSATAVKVDSDGNATPSTLSCKKYKQVGSASPVETSDFQLFYKTSAMSDDAYNSYGGVLNSDTSLEWYEFVLASDTPTADGAIIYDRETVPVVKDGENGNDAESYSVILTKGTKYISSVLSTVINVSFRHQKGTDVVTSEDPVVISDYASVKCYVDGVENEDMTNWLNNGSGYFAYSAYESAWSGKSTITVTLFIGTTIVASANFALSQKGEKGDTGDQGEQGEQGKSALEVVISPETLVFDTNDDGIVPTGTAKTATITCYRDGVRVTDVDYILGELTNCTASYSQSNGAYFVTISKIATENITSDGTTYTVSKTSGTVDVTVTDNTTGTNQKVQVKFAVNVSKFTGGMVATQKKFQTSYTELSNNVDSLSDKVDGKMDSFDLTEYKSEILQTAREISLSVSEKVVGRRNLLIGTAARRYDDGWEYMSNGAYYSGYPCEVIEVNSGKDGVNCIHCRTTSSYNVGFQWVGGRASTQGNVKLERGKKYTLSFYAKTSSPSSVTFVTECIWEGSSSDNSRPAGHAGPTNYSKEYTLNDEDAGTWTLCQVTIEVPASASYEYVEVNIFARGKSSSMVEAYICKPMLEEGDKYNGWTLSEQDYDYVGGNLIDNSRTLTAVSGKLVINGTVTQNGYGGESAVLYKGMSALLGRVTTKYSLPSSASSGDKYATTEDGKVWQYTGTSVSDDDHYNGWERVSTENLHNDLLEAHYSLEANKDYIFSWYAKGSGMAGAYVAGASQTVFAEHSDGEVISSTTYGKHAQLLTNEWKRYWMHVRCVSGAVNRFIIRQYRNDDNTASTIYLTQPKLEEGATMTEWTEKKTDLVDKQALLATGIDIESRKVTVTADKFVVQNNSGTQTALVTSDGKLTTSLIDANSIMTQSLTATNLTVKGNSTLGIFHVLTSSSTDRDGYNTDGDMIGYSGTYKQPDGSTEITDTSGKVFLTYKPLFMTQGVPDYNQYMRVGNRYTEWDDIYSTSYNYLFVGAAARFVCQGSSALCGTYKLPSNKSYNSGYSPSLYLYSEKESQSDPALAINVQYSGTAGPRMAIKTNGVISGAFAPNVANISYTQTLDGMSGIILCTNSSEMTLTMPAKPIVGQIIRVIQQGSGKVVFSTDSTHQFLKHGGSIVTSCNSNRLGQVSTFIWTGTYWVCYFADGIL